ncbi:MAG TPA: HAD family phosphatase [Mycobacteriales bacterium]|nr:HAD family phosphatase [Mycobacteriales bacterium]
MPDAASTFTALVVDYGGVLTTSLGASFQEFSDTEDIDREHIQQVVLAAYDDGRPSPLHLIETGSVTLDEFEAELAARLRTRTGGSVAARGLVQRMFAGARPDSRMLDAVRRARSAGLRTALLSNSWGNRDQYNFDHFDTLFDAVVISGEVGLRKPDHGIYQLLCRELGVPAAECVFVDDIGANIRAAAEVGMCGVHHVDTDTTLAELELLLGLPFSAPFLAGDL